MTYKHQWNKKWGFARKRYLHTQRWPVIFTRRKIAVAMITYNSLTLFYLCAAMLYPVGIFVLNEIKMKKDKNGSVRKTQLKLKNSSQF